MLVYSAGLRVGEVVRLKPEDIDSKRMLIHVRGAKGRKDRYTLLSESAFKVSKEYLNRDKPPLCLFPGPDKERHISIRTAQRIFEMACNRAGVKKEVTIHSLRHSFATLLSKQQIIFTHGLVKKEQKTPKGEIEKAMSIRKALRGEK